MDRSIGPDSGAARNLADFLGSIVTFVTTRMEDITLPPVHCRKRPRNKPCRGDIQIYTKMDTMEIIWKCPECSDNGFIHHWQGTLWDCRRRNSV